MSAAELARWEVQPEVASSEQLGQELEGMEGVVEGPQVGGVSVTAEGGADQGAVAPTLLPPSEAGGEPADDTTTEDVGETAPPGSLELPRVGEAAP